MRLLLFFLVLLLGFITVGCQNQDKTISDIENLGRATGSTAQPTKGPSMKGQMAQKSPTGTPPKEMMQAIAQMQKEGGGTVHTGQVVETIDASIYTYVQFKTDKEQPLWAAIPKTKLEKGQQIKISQSIVMKEFTSPTLGRKFSSIIFGTLENNPKK